MASLRAREPSARASHPDIQPDETAVDIPTSRRKPRPAPSTTVDKVGKVFAQGYMSDETIADYVQRNFGCILCWASCALFFMLGSAYMFRLSVIAKSRGSVIPRTRFCSHNPYQCQYTAYIKSVLFDFRKTRDAQMNPSGVHTQFEAEHFKVDRCTLPVRLHYTDPRISQWWGHILEEQAAALAQCPMPCEVVANASDAHVMIGMFNAPEGVRRRERLQKGAVITLEGHSMSKEALAGADMLVSFHERSDVVVNYFYSLTHGVACLEPAGDCLLDAVQSALEEKGAALRQTEGRSGLKRRKAAMFVSNLCDRHGNFLKELLDHLAMDIGVDSYGLCFHNAREKDHPLYVGDNAEESKELISGAYKFHLVSENVLVDDYVTEKFYEGLKAGSLMVYLGAPNIAKYAPAPNAFVNAHNFAGPEELAAYLVELDRNATLYASYFTWRSEPAWPSGEFRALAERDFARAGSESWQCRLCQTFVHRFCPK